jgi:hypothetical protein
MVDMTNEPRRDPKEWLAAAVDAAISEGAHRD